MKTSNSLVLALSLVLGAAAAGCGADPSAMPGGDDGSGGDDGGGGGGNVPPKPLDATGTYAMHSTFDLATNMPGTAGEVVTTIIAATDGSDDPTHWLLDQIIGELPDNTVTDILKDSEGFVAGYLNDRLLDLAPDFVSTMVLVGRDFGTIAKNFGLNETLALTGTAGNYTAVHTITGAHFKLGNQDVDYSLASYHVPNVVVPDVAVTMDPTGQLTIAAHNVPLAYGKLLRLGLDGAIIPLIDGSAHGLNDLIAHKIDCKKIGAAIADAIHIGSASTFEAACTTGIATAANYVYHQIDLIDGTALQFGINGTARAMDKNNDRTIDAIVTGTWAGTLSYGTTPTPLVPAAFFGERM